MLKNTCFLAKMFSNLTALIQHDTGNPSYHRKKTSLKIKRKKTNPLLFKDNIIIYT